MKLYFERFTIPLQKYWETHPKMVWLLSILWVLLIGWLAFFWHLGSIGLVDETEPLFAEAARQMLVTGDWITPYFNGDTRFDKPALVYWLMAIAYRLIGVNEWAVRLPSALAAMALTVLGFYTLQRFGFPNSKVGEMGRWGDGENNPTTSSSQSPVPSPQSLSAWIGAALIALNPITIAWARTGVSDMLLSGCMGTSLFCFFIGYATKDESNSAENQKKFFLNISPWYVAFYVLSALAVLTKGPVGIVLPLVIISGFVIYLGNWREVWREMRPIWGSLIFSAIALPWYILCYLRNGEAFIDAFFGYHNVERFTQVVNRHSAPWYFYFLVVLIGFFPWSIYLPLAIAKLRFWQVKKWRNSSRSSQLGLFALAWFFGIFGFFTIAVTKLPSYVIPLMPAAAILVALLFSEQILFVTSKKFLITDKQKFQTNQGLFWSGIFNVVLSTAIAGLLFYLPSILGYDPAIPDLHQLLEKSGLTIRGFWIWGISAIVLVFLLQNRRRLPFIVVANLLTFVAFLTFVLTPTSFLLDSARQMPLRELSAVIKEVENPGEELFMIGFKKPSVVFYTQQKVDYFEGFNETFNYIRKTATANPNRTSVLILSQSTHVKPELLDTTPHQVLAKTKAYKLIRVQVSGD
ncbi:ArnT family glycosyltransferase [Floridanema evergladense]|uniref:ArnT family glycosyltransferase n=1 Tax=Floridaenema evergladense BLCC-F167 TaxID=3153639 RepID=A0ABV4WG73_9CYAN